MNTSRTIMYLHDGRAWVAELRDGRARVSSLVAWLSAHPGRGALRSLELEQPGPTAPRSSAAPSGRAGAGGGLASLLGRVLGKRSSPHPHAMSVAGERHGATPMPVRDVLDIAETARSTR